MKRMERMRRSLEAATAFVKKVDAYAEKHELSKSAAAIKLGFRRQKYHDSLRRVNEGVKDWSPGPQVKVYEAEPKRGRPLGGTNKKKAAVPAVLQKPLAIVVGSPEQLVSFYRTLGV